MSLDIAIERVSPLWSRLPGIEQLAERAILAAARDCGVALRDDAEVSVQLVDDQQIRALNARWRRIDKATNVLAFPAASTRALASTLMLGDIVVAYETAHREADEQAQSLSDHAAHLIVHGFLHLVGFDHQDADEATRMEMLETRILGEIGIADPYAVTVPADETI